MFLEYLKDFFLILNKFKIESFIFKNQHNSPRIAKIT